MNWGNSINKILHAEGNGTGRPLLGLFAVLAMTACDHSPLKELQRLYEVDASRVTAQADFCTLSPDKEQTFHLIVPILDHSGSTVDFGTPGTPTFEPGTDPTGNRRYSGLVSLLNQVAKTDSDYYALIEFDTNSNVAKVNGSDFTNDPQAFLAQAIKPYYNPPSYVYVGGWTNYMDALSKAYLVAGESIRYFKSLNPKAKIYIDFIFYSDGVPDVPDGKGGIMEQPWDANSAPIGPYLKDSVDLLLSLAQTNNDVVGNISLSTGYFHLPAASDPDFAAASLLLKEMASEGHGTYTDVSTGQSIDWSQYAVAVALIKHEVRTVMVQPMNILWDNTKGAMVLDSDGDGLPDYLEVKLGSDPLKADSDGNGVPDGVEYRRSGKPCKADKCLPSGAEPYLQCNGFEVTPGAVPRVFQHQDGDATGMDACSKYILGARPDLFDTNGDGLTDAVKFSFSLPFVSGVSATMIDSDNDGQINYDEVVHFTPPFINNAQLIYLQPITYQMSMVSSSASQDCYHLEANNIPTFGLSANVTNNVKLIVIEEKAIIDRSEILRTSVKAVPSGSNVITFTNSDLK